MDLGKAPGKQQFLTNVYPSELRSINKRRSVWELPPGSGTFQEAAKEANQIAGHADPKAIIPPDVSHGTVGLALSGGGIRSATFNLGVLQVFAKRGLLKWFDYLSTVSGGGYIGSNLSATLTSEDPKRKSPGYSLLHIKGTEEPQAIKHLRSGGNYLAPGGLLDLLRIPAILLRGVATNLLVTAPFVGVLALLTVWLYPADLAEGAEHHFFLLTPWVVGIFAAWIALFPLLATLFPHVEYGLRSAYERSFSLLLLLVIAVPLLEALPWLYHEVFVGLTMAHFLSGAVTGTLAIVPVLRSLTASEKIVNLADKIKVVLIGLLGPAILLFLYLFMTRWIFRGSAGNLQEIPRRMIAFSIALAAVFIFTRLFVNVNKSGMHRFYRDRLSKAYLLDPVNNRHVDNLQLSKLEIGKTGAPYHLVNTSLNIPGTKDKEMQGRGADFFVFSPKWSGSFQTGYCPTERLEKEDLDLNLGTCFAISGAAAAPYMGTSSSHLAFVLTLLNIRLDYWIPNPARFSASRGRQRLDRVLYQVGPLYLLFELLGWLTARSKFVNLSDGGHIENLGLYELLRRRCKFIVCSDAEEDLELELSSLGKVSAYARMDQGIEIKWTKLHRLQKNGKGYSTVQWAYGTIDYGSEEKGQIIYLKSSLSGHEPQDIAAYHAKNPSFPHQSTGDQFFDESQFESYRALGYYIASQLFDPGTTEVTDLAQWFEARKQAASSSVRSKSGRQKGSRSAS